MLIKYLRGLSTSSLTVKLTKIILYIYDINKVLDFYFNLLKKTNSDS